MKSMEKAWKKHIKSVGKVREELSRRVVKVWKKCGKRLGKFGKSAEKVGKRLWKEYGTSLEKNVWKNVLKKAWGKM